MSLDTATAYDAEGVPPQERDLVTSLVDLVRVFENGVGKDFKERNDGFFKQYRGFKQFRDAWIPAGPNDRDGLLFDAKKTWGAHLHIPLSFQTIETIVPKAIAQEPRMLVRPRDEQWKKNVEAIRLLIDRQQNQINIDLAYQDAMRAGRMYGLGAGKFYWDRKTTVQRKVEPKVFRKGFKTGKLREEVVFDDPRFEALDVYDFLWDPNGYDLDTCEWAAHRVWLSTHAVMARLTSGAWATESAKALAAKGEEEVRSIGGGSQHWDEVWQERLTTSGFPSWATSQTGTRGEQPHEVIEFHDGERVLTILDREVLVQEAENPCCGMSPFTIYRPTPLLHQMVGIGDLEPIQHLQRELDSLRSQRRDAATITLCAPLAYDSTMLTERELTIGPGVTIPMDGNPQEGLMKLDFRDIPASGYQEEQAIMANIEGVTGLSDALAAQPGGSQTATEAQLVQASLSARVQLGSRRFEQEVVRQSGRGFLRLDQYMILENRPALMVPDEGKTPEEAWESGDWKQYPIGPGELMGEYEIEMEGGSMAAPNVPQERADGRAVMELFAQSYYVNPTKPLEYALEKFGIKHPQAWMKAEEPTVPAMALKLLELAGVDPTLIEEAVLRARTASAPQEGPGPEMVTTALGGSPLAGAGANGNGNGTQ